LAQYSIKTLEQLSGIKAHTIRIWEQRYQLLAPQRTDTNIRFYDDAALKMLLNVAALYGKGFKISRIAGMSPTQISEEVITLTETSGNNALQINALVTAMIALNEKAFNQIINNQIKQAGLETTMLEIVYPFLEKIGILWQTNNICPAHEHFVSNLIRQKIITAIDNLETIDREKARGEFLLFLPEGELHELALLFMTFLLRARNFHCLYLGQNLPFPDLLAAFASYQPDYIVTVLTSFPGPDQVQEYLHKLADTFKQQEVWVYGYQVQSEQLTIPANLKRHNRISEFISCLDNL